ncbi:MAG: GatB/YqeY domain-containing protein [Candidatus Kryptoniota bacterium]
MSIIERINSDIKSAMLKGDKERLETLRMIKAKLLEKQVEKRVEPGGMSEEDEMQVLVSSAKMRKEAIEQFEKGGRKDLADRERVELTIINEYLPQQLSVQEVEQIVLNIIKNLGATSLSDFGRVMQAAIKELKGKADGKTVQEIVRSRLSAQGGSS